MAESKTTKVTAAANIPLRAFNRDANGNPTSAPAARVERGDKFEIPSERVKEFQEKGWIEK